MAQIPRAALDFLTKEVRGFSADAKEKVSRLLESIEWRPDNIAECRAALVDALLSVMPTYADAAAQAGADFYDAVRAYEVGEAIGAQAFSGFDPEAFEGAVRAFAQAIVDGKPVELFNVKVVDRVDRDIRRSANMSVAENAQRDPLKPKYARVPGGGETCEFCIMLASRGAVYGTAEAASHAHPGCDCRIVPSFGGEHDIEGYDPDELYGLWKAIAAHGRGSSRKGEVEKGFPRIVGEHSMKEDLAATNPRFHEGLEWQTNCQRCVGAYEMRRRGYDVTSKPRPMSSGEPDKHDELPYMLASHGWPRMFGDMEPERVSGSTYEATVKRIVGKMNGFGDGSRAIVRVQWKGRNGGHVFIAEQMDGEVRFIDPQTNSDDCLRYFRLAEKNETFILRVDDKEISNLISQAVTRCDQEK